MTAGTRKRKPTAKKRRGSRLSVDLDLPVYEALAARAKAAGMVPGEFLKAEALRFARISLDAKPRAGSTAAASGVSTKRGREETALSIRERNELRRSILRDRDSLLTGIYRTDRLMTRRLQDRIKLDVARLGETAIEPENETFEHLDASFPEKRKAVHLRARIVERLAEACAVAELNGGVEGFVEPILRDILKSIEEEDFGLIVEAYDFGSDKAKAKVERKLSALASLWREADKLGTEKEVAS